MQTLPLTRNNTFFLLLSFLALFISGCARYKPHVFRVPTTACVEKDNVRVSATLLSEKDCQYYFSKKIIKKGFQPIQLYVENNSDEKLILDGADITLPIEQRDYVANALHVSDAMYVTPGIAAGLVLGIPPILYGTLYCFVWSLCEVPEICAVGVSYIVIGAVLFLIPLSLFLYGLSMAKKADKALDKDFMLRVFDKHSIKCLKPHAVLNTVFFVSQNVVKNNSVLTVPLYSAEKNATINVACKLA